MTPSRRLLAVAAAAVLATAGASPAATVVERRVELAISGDELLETTYLEVAIEEPGDLSAWSEYGFLLDDHIELVSVEARVLGGGRDERIPRRRCREETSTGYGLHTSQSTMVIPFPGLSLGQHLVIEYVRRHRPYFPNHRVILAMDQPQQRLSVTVRGGGGHLRWRLDRADDSIAVEREQPELVLVGRDVPRWDPLVDEPDADCARPVLKLAWDDGGSWQDVGRWYRRLVAEVPRARPAVLERARAVTVGLDDPRRRLEALATEVRRMIRYEAVEVGPGGWIPTPADETLRRGWGDCKDMSELLAELLRAVGIPASLTLVRNGLDGAVDPDFPGTLGFNHCVVAVPAGAVGATADDVTADGFLILDPTMDRGGPTWLSPFLQGQHALVVGDDRIDLVTVPVTAETEGRGLLVAGRLDADGTFSGTATLRLFGSRALAWLAGMRSVEPGRIDQTIRQLLQETIPAASTGTVAWRELAGDVPAVELTAGLTVPGVASGSAARPRLRLDGLDPLPDSVIYDGRTRPVVLTPGVHRSLWQLELPAGWCPARPEDSAEVNPAGSVRRSVTNRDDGVVVVDRLVTVARPWYEPASFDDLKALSVAASHADRRSIRLDCDAPSQP